jgi:hypothetical protein
LSHQANWDRCTLTVHGSVSGLSLGGNFRMQIEMSADDLVKFVKLAAQESEMLSAALKAALAHGDARRVGAKIK